MNSVVEPSVKKQRGRAQRKKSSVVERLHFFHFWVGDHT